MDKPNSPHPLTDEICDQIAVELDEQPRFILEYFKGVEDCMRAATDWQLEQCAEELECLLSIFVATGVIKKEAVPTAVELFKSNMRPQEES